ncbi:titin homolog isoform X2 [Drosophila mojavensis]|uniref:Uncharacterized protein, isoform B n=1 Tax=Drosophila mojavensis TaxID=7230 RepID=A0A0Q9XTI8_DROMO|nr:titin homolog isoform X2 [Drosophila mojavensis]KRG07155.1 uncharacterized protein Dmoj_GI16084, isoform B [Drosophila mojavensis]
MAFVATNDQHGNEVMRVVLSTEPGNKTVASCQNVRINCSSVGVRSYTHAGRFDHRHRFHYFADTAPRLRKTDLFLLHGQKGYKDGKNEQALGKQQQEINKHQKLERGEHSKNKKKHGEADEALLLDMPGYFNMTMGRKEQKEKAQQVTLKPKLKEKAVQTELKDKAVQNTLDKKEMSDRKTLQLEQKENAELNNVDKKEKSEQKTLQVKQKVKSGQQTKHRYYSQYLEWSYEAISESEKESQLKQISQPIKSQSERSKYEMKPQLINCQTERLKPESLHLEFLKEEKIQVMRLKAEKSQPEMCLQGDLQPKREKRTQAKQKVQLQMTPKLALLHSDTPRVLRTRSHTEPNLQTANGSQRKAKSQNNLPQDPDQNQEKKSSRTSSHHSHGSLTVSESGLWNSAEVIAHSTLLSMQEQMAKRDSNNSSPLSSPFYAWLAAKKEKQDQLKKERRLSTELEEQRAKERSRLAQLNFERWVKSKNTQLRRAKSDVSSGQLTTHSRQSLPASESQRRLIEWEREKLAELREQRLKREAYIERQNQLETARREMSAEAFEQWVLASRNKPKPVPMGKGLDSLRGTTAPLFTNPNEWKSVHGPIVKKPQNPPPQPRPKRQGPDYERLERLAQPRRAICKQSPNVRREPLKLGETGPLSKLSNSLDSCLLRPHRTSMVWSKDNAQRVREMKRNESLGGYQAQHELHDDQVEQLRKQQDQQNNKTLPKKFQDKREKLRLRLKDWLEEGKALPQRSRNNSSTDLNYELKLEKHALKQQQRRAVFAEEAAQMQRRRVVFNETRILRSDEHLLSAANKSNNPLQRARSIEPKHLLKSKEPQKVKPWR